MGNFLTRSCYDQPNRNSLQITIEGLVKENEELKKKLESLEIENSDKNIIVKNNNLDVIEDQLKVSVESLVNELMKNDNINSDLIPDFVEKKIYENVLTLAISLLKETLEKTKITILNQDITFNFEPSK
tara:strand:+ start:84 stop:470 length:387 start_codon:yes stop_codon:yes gene_type:complete